MLHWPIMFLFSGVMTLLSQPPCMPMIFASVAASEKMKPVINVLPDTLDDVSIKLENIGLRIATEESRFMFQNPPRKYLCKITLTVRPHPLQHQLRYPEDLQHATGQSVLHPASSTQCADREPLLLRGALYQPIQVTAPPP